jgi:sugar phosphate permease
MVGLFFSFGKIMGVMIVISLELIFNAAPFTIYWRVLFSMTGVFAVLQTTLIFFFGKDTPTELI